jgi:hypothetical protein
LLKNWQTPGMGGPKECKKSHSWNLNSRNAL